MSYKHRFMFIGLGGTGLKVGKELEQLLRRQICGADGLELTRQGKFADYKKNQLPPFYQSVYVDFSQDEMKGLENYLNELDPTAIGSTASIVATLSSASSYQRIAAKLRANHSEIVSEWLPGPDGQPTHAPMSTGAAQFPTIGRAALFDRISDVGIGGVFSPMEKAFGRLAASTGELQAYNDSIGGGDKSGASGIVIFVAASLSGGTGSGLFLDVIKIATAMAQKNLGGIEVTVIPLIAGPSAFKGSASDNQMRMLNLNFARGILDLSELVDHSNATDVVRERFFRQQYPSSQEKFEVDITSNGAAPLFTTFLFSRPVAYKDVNDLWRSMAVYATTLVSQADTEVLKDPTGNMTGLHTVESADRFAFFQDIINLRSANKDEALHTIHPTGIGRLSMVEAATASLSVPVKKLSYFLAQYMALQAAESLHDQIGSSSNAFAEYVDRDLEGSKDCFDQMLARLPEGHWVNELINVLNPNPDKEDFWPTGLDSTLDIYTELQRKTDPKKRKKLKWSQHVSNAVDSQLIETAVQDEMIDAATTLLNKAIGAIATSSGWKSAMGRYQAEVTVNKFAPLEALAVFQAHLHKLMRSRLQEVNPTIESKPKVAEKKGIFGWASDVSKKHAESNLADLRVYILDQYRDAVIRAFQQSQQRRGDLEQSIAALDRWQTGAVNSVLQLRARKLQIESGWGSLTSGSSKAGFRDWIPSRLTTRGDGQKLDQASLLLREVFAVAMKTAKFGLEGAGPWKAFSAVTQDQGQRIWAKSAEKADAFLNHSLEELQKLFDEALVTSAEGRPALLATIADVLRVAAGIAPTRKMEGANEDVLEMGKALSELIPDGLVPEAKDCKQAFIVVTYPGRQNDDVEKYLEDRLRSNSSLSVALALSKGVKYHASRTSDAITISIALALRGLMDIPEARNALRTWDAAYQSGGQMLPWRQRTSSTDLARLAAERDQLPVLQSFLHMVWDNHVRYFVADGDRLILANPNNVKLTEIAAIGIPATKMLGADGETQELVVNLRKVGRLSGISTFTASYSRAILNLYCDGQPGAAGELAKKVGNYLAKGFKGSGSRQKPSIVFQQILDEWAKSEVLVQEALKEAERIGMPGIMGRARHAKFFYSEELRRAFEEVHPSTSEDPDFRNLKQFWEQAETGKR
jgi:hypothetical protein